MLKYIFKRLLITLPALWILVTIVFLLSRFLPGPAGEEQILKDNGSYYSTGSAEGRQKAFRAYLERTGQDLPLFYFTLKASTDPDTLHLVYPETERQFLKKISWRYGNWPAAVNYYNHLKKIRNTISAESDITLNNSVEHLFFSFEADDIQDNIQKLEQTAEDLEIKIQLSQLKNAASKLTNNERRFAFILPNLSWHGTNNQYHQWLAVLLKGNLGTSYKDNRPVSEIIIDAFSSTIWLIAISILISFSISLELSIFLIRHKTQHLKKYFLPVLFVLDSIPLFLLALIMLVFFASPSFLQLFPVFGLSVPSAITNHSWLELLGYKLQYMALPAICLILVNIPYITNLMLRALTEQIRSDYARTARAKGLSESQVIRRHVLKNTLLPIITIFSDAIPAVLAGTVVIETIFAIPGMGRLLVNSVMARDYPVIVAIVLCVAIVRIVSYLLADIGYGMADPRIKHRSL